MLYKRRTIIINVMLIELGAVTAISAAAAHLSKYLVLNPCLGRQSIKYARLGATIINRKTAADTKRIGTT